MSNFDEQERNRFYREENAARRQKVYDDALTNRNNFYRQLSSRSQNHEPGPMDAVFGAVILLAAIFYVVLRVDKDHGHIVTGIALAGIIATALLVRLFLKSKAGIAFVNFVKLLLKVLLVVVVIVAAVLIAKYFAK
jgi:hypothetical protein